MVTVLITTSGTGSRLGLHTQYTNKSLIKIGDVYAISHILQQYPEFTEFVITLGHFGSHVKEFLEMAYPNKIFQFVEIDKYEGPGSSLGYSMLKAQGYLQKPFYFHCCDALVKESFVKCTNNCVMVSKGISTDSYSSIRVKAR